LVALRWSDIELQIRRLHVRRAKSGTPSVHPISARESRVLRRLQREAPASPYVFISERGAPLSVAGYQRMVAIVVEPSQPSPAFPGQNLMPSVTRFAKRAQNVRSPRAHLRSRSTVNRTSIANPCSFWDRSVFVSVLHARFFVDFVR
jgi:type 1 fimbriae regulatory protein FimB/type 1 fimbriae regulatory protein FimE